MTHDEPEPLVFEDPDPKAENLPIYDEWRHIYKLRQLAGGRPYRAAGEAMRVLFDGYAAGDKHRDATNEDVARLLRRIDDPDERAAAAMMLADSITYLNNRKMVAAIVYALLEG